MEMLSDQKQKEIKTHLYSCKKCSDFYQQEIRYDREMSKMIPNYIYLNDKKNIEDVLKSIEEIERKFNRQYFFFKK